jgi:hypothetical protein
LPEPEGPTISVSCRVSKPPCSSRLSRLQTMVESKEEKLRAVEMSPELAASCRTQLCIPSAATADDEKTLLVMIELFFRRHERGS